jgi:transposase InsO family protein
VIELGQRLTADGLDAGPVTIGWYLQQEGLKAPAPATISRILTRVGLINPQPRKRPRSSYTRFEMAQLSEMWQSDFIHWQLADGADVEVLNWLDDHSRYLLSCTAHAPVTGDDVVAVFLAVIDDHGAPQSTLTDNGRVYTARFGGGRNAFEYLLPILGIRQKNGSPGHPQTQGKTERFTRPCSAGSEPGQRRAPSPSSKPSSTSSASITTSGALTARCIAQSPATPTAPPPKPHRPPTDTPPATTGCATTGSTPPAR